MIEVRITNAGVDIAQIFNKYPLSFFVEEDASRLHVQGIIDTNHTLQTVRNLLKSLGLKGNADYKCAQVKDLDKYLNYLCKGTKTLQPIVVYNGMNINVEERWTNWDHELKQKPMSKVDKIFEGFVFTEPKWKNIHDYDDLMYQASIYAVHYYKKNDLLINPGLIKNYVITYLVKNHCYENELAIKIAKNIEKI